MIFVTVGTTAFDSLIRTVDKAKIKGRVVIQKADGKYQPQNYEFFDYTDNFDDYIKKADIVITHGGAGTLFKLLALNKKIIGIANEERRDLHQWDILKKLSQEKYLIWCQDLDQIPRAIEKVKKQKLKKYIPPTCEIADLISDFLHTY